LIGNDIVDLTDPRAAGKSRDIRFMDRVFTTNERQAIFNHNNRDVFLWSLWAGKETAYKAICKVHPAVSSSPRRYEIELFPSAGLVPERGVAHTPFGLVSIRLFVRSDHLHCVGVTDGLGMDSVMWDVLKVDQRRSSQDYQSNIARKMIKRKASCYLNESPGTMEIIRTRGCHGLEPPVLYVRKTKTPIDISMSHDGRFVACALLDISGESKKQ
jgi:phosphopantetheinyl transferase